jgi:hypothetical protein
MSLERVCKDDEDVSGGVAANREMRDLRRCR